MDIESVAFERQQTGPVVSFGNIGSLFGLELFALVRHFQEQQIGKLLDVIAVGETRIAQDVAVIPESLNNRR